MMVPLDVKLYHGSHLQLHSLELREDAIGVDKQIPRKPVRIDEAPGSLERSDVAVQTSTHPVAGSRQRARGDLLCYSSATIIGRDIELHGLTRSKGWLSILHLLGGEQEVVAMNEQIAVEGCRVQEAPAVCKSSDVAAVSLSDAVLGFPAHHGFQSHCMWPSPLIRLDVEFDRFVLLEVMILTLCHNVLGFEGELALEQVRADETPSGRGRVLRNGARQTLVPKGQWVRHWTRVQGGFPLGASLRRRARHLHLVKSTMPLLPVGGAFSAVSL
mmetsp:Transcript_49632/g.105649  ORF Transcript_49632/g.105649 Transcript_49632/m.105649 type:complete len:272 (-) Transcript_49632:115-930(-)